jgi:hypothetical protein
MGSIKYFPGCEPEPEIDRYQRLREERAQEIFYTEILHFVSRLQDVQCMTEAVRCDIDNLLHSIYHYTPTRDEWNKKAGIK